ncbi:hypothetical protein M441DRAFT_59378 [Trichoderma asperellum CBS 433.97]|uniref:Uncharacterized protein n=1 Tax=Trichoderma asperellum (strain ATCC 204424 / CBS 433.97 / NBRC 101777) TaxID=1042311 RepID=A0A2T3Z3C6_TRIA4|nr:hypothetical protein M441DRAFT_59378 [Trichoderma asperellum CBS 433.97]PTB39321.1 hypothetical protein M441DRAFT_59378 [Trichoderma asperellum CBS 433.97]
MQTCLSLSLSLLSLSLSYCFSNVAYVCVSIIDMTIVMTSRKCTEIRICRFQ